MNSIHAKKLFLKYDGSHFAMAQEAWPDYIDYLALNISEEQEKQWRYEIVNQRKKAFERSKS